MNSKYVTEYDNYSLPEMLKKETPETKEKLAGCKSEIKAIAARHRKEAEAQKGVSH